MATTAQFCQIDPSDQRTCQDAVDAMYTNIIKASDCYQGCSKPEAPDHHFHRMTFSQGGNGTSPDGPAQQLAYDRTETSTAAPHRWVWSYGDDAARWETAGLIKSLGPLGKAALHGTVWTHASTMIGTPGPTGVDIGTGVHGAELSDHHELSVQPEHHFCNAGGIVVGPMRPFFLWRFLPDPPPPLGDPFRRPDAVHGEASFVAWAEAVDGTGGWGALDTLGLAPFVTERLGVNLQGRLQDTSLVWTNAVEPFLWQGRGVQFPTAIALTADGSAIADTVVNNGVSLLAEADRGAPSSNAESQGAAPHLDGFVPVLSRMRGGVFVVGGSQARGGGYSGEIWFTPAADGPARWSRLPTRGFRPEKARRIRS